MVAVREDAHRGAVPSLSHRDLSSLLTEKAEILASTWRRRYYANDTALTAVAQIDGVVEPLIEQLGASVDNPLDLPAAAWGRTPGVLRLSHSRGVDGLAEEFMLLRAVLEEAAMGVLAPYAQRKRLRALLDAAYGQAASLFARLGDVEDIEPALGARFGGVVVETL